jgi:flagellar assembly protein FliH
LSNLLKRGSTIAKEERVIDYNDIIKEKLSKMTVHTPERKKAEPDEDGFIHGLDAEVVEQLVTDDDDETGMTSEQAAARISEANAEAERIIAQANQQADEIIKGTESASQNAVNQGREKGYNEGMIRAQGEIEASKRQLEAEYAKKQEQLEAEYEEKKAAIEPQLVEVMTEVFKSVITSEAVDNQDILMHLIDTALNGAEKNHEYTIKVSPADYDYVSANQGKISCHVDRGIDIEVLEEPSFEKNQCVIETDGAVFDCSLNVEMDNLIKKIKMLSCMG